MKTAKEVRKELKRVEGQHPAYDEERRQILLAAEQTLRWVLGEPVITPTDYANLGIGKG